MATRAAYGDALVKLAKNNQHVIAMDGDTKNSTFSIKLRDAFPDRYVECFIAEQNLVGVGMGAACRDRRCVQCTQVLNACPLQNFKGSGISVGPLYIYPFTWGHSDPPSSFETSPGHLVPPSESRKDRAIYCCGVPLKLL